MFRLKGVCARNLNEGSLMHNVPIQLFYTVKDSSLADNLIVHWGGVHINQEEYSK